MKWLHISDLHMRGNGGEKEGVNTLILRDALITYLETEVGQVDFLMLSGDYRYAKDEKPANSEEICDWIYRIAKAVKINDIAGQVCMVPGNHDVQRSDLRDKDVKTVQWNYDSKDGYFTRESLENLLSHGFKEYDRLYRKIYGRSYIEEAINGDNPHQILDLENCYLLLLNTALISHGNTDRGQLLVGSRYVWECLQEKKDINKPIIILAHHGMNLLDTHEIQELIPVISHNNPVVLYLCGDAHELREEKQAYGYQVTAGCMCRNGKGADIVFTTGEVMENHIAVRAHSWLNNKWAPETHFGNKGVLWIGESLENTDNIDLLVDLSGLRESKLSPNLQNVFINEIKQCLREDRQFRTPQILCILLNSHNCSLKKYMDQYTVTTQDGVECVGDYLYRKFMRESLLKDRSNFDYNIDVRNLFGLDCSEMLLKEQQENGKKLKYITEDMIAYAVLSNETGTTAFIKKVLKNSSRLEEIKKNLLFMNIKPSYSWDIEGEN